MRIAFIGDGASVHNHFMIDWFLEQGHEVCFLTDTPNESINCHTEFLVPRKGKQIRHLQAAWKTRSFLKRWKPDIVHAHNITGYGYWGALSGIRPLVLTAWGSDILLLPEQNFIIKSLVQYAVKRAEFITADAHSLHDAVQNLSTKELDVRMLQWGINLSEVDQPPDEQFVAELRGGADFVFLSNRRLRPLYNIDAIIHAFAQVYSKHPNTRLVIGGEDELSDALRRQVQELGLGDSVHFTGWLTRRQVFDSLHAADAWISVPTSDSTPLSLLEAFAAKLPVIVSDLPAMHEWIRDGKNGYLVSPQDSQALIEDMCSMVENINVVRDWGISNRQTVEECANREVEMNRLLSWYREILPDVAS